MDVRAVRVQVGLRLPKWLRDLVNDQAHSRGLSRNEFIVQALRHQVQLGAVQDEKELWGSPEEVLPESELDFHERLDEAVGHAHDEASTPEELVSGVQKAIDEVVEPEPEKPRWCPHNFEQVKTYYKQGTKREIVKCSQCGEQVDRRWRRDRR
jgi:hypothetical protein